MAIPLPWYTSFNWIKYSKYEYVHCQCIPTSALNWCQCISNHISMHLTKKYFSTWNIHQISASLIINHHGHYPRYCWRHVGVNWISQCTLCEILRVAFASSTLKNALTHVNVNAFLIHRRDNACLFFIISQNWDGPDSENLSSLKTGADLSCIINTVAADVLATHGARTSTAIVLTQFQNIPVSSPEELQLQLIETEWRRYASVNLPSLVQIMTCRLVGAKPLSEPMIEYCWFDHQEQTSVKY